MSFTRKQNRSALVTKDVEKKTLTSVVLKKDLFQSIAKNIICSTCKLVPRCRIFQNLKMGEILCQRCQLHLVPNHKKKYLRNKILEATLETFAMTGCKFRGNGCTVVDDLESITKHEENKCQFRWILCPFTFCNKGIFFQDLRQHLLDNHSYYLDSDYFYFECNGSTYTIKVDKINIQDFKESYVRWMLTFPKSDKVFMLMINGKEDPETNSMESLQLWVQYVGGRDISQRFNSKIQIGNQTHGKFIYEGPIKCIDDNKEEIVKSRFGLVVECEKIKHYIKNGEFEVEVILDEINPSPEDFTFDHEIKTEVI